MTSGTVTGATGGVGTKGMMKEYPNTEGLVTDTTYQEGNPNLLEEPW